MNFKLNFAQSVKLRLSSISVPDITCLVRYNRKRGSKTQLFTRSPPSCLTLRLNIALKVTYIFSYIFPCTIWNPKLTDTSVTSAQHVRASTMFSLLTVGNYWNILMFRWPCILANDQLNAQIFNTFIIILYMHMFRAVSCSSSGGQIVLIQHLVSSLSVSDRPVHQTVTYWQWRYQMLY